jgi:hypothetical protein
MNPVDYLKDYWYIGLIIVVVCIGVIIYNVSRCLSRRNVTEPKNSAI